jgi:hypothetical protein
VISRRRSYSRISSPAGISETAKTPRPWIGDCALRPRACIALRISRWLGTCIRLLGSPLAHTQTASGKLLSESLQLAWSRTCPSKQAARQLHSLVRRHTRRGPRLGASTYESDAVVEHIPVKRLEEQPERDVLEKDGEPIDTMSTECLFPVNDRLYDGWLSLILDAIADSSFLAR